MSNVTIRVVSDFHPHPYGRNEVDAPNFPGTGLRFRKDILEPALHKNDHVDVVLDGYNRYGRSFLDEAFGGLIRDAGFTLEDLQRKLSYSHSTVKSFEDIIEERIKAAAKEIEDQEKFADQ